MKKKKNSIIGWVWLVIIVLFITGLVRHFHIKNFNVIKPGVLYTSGQPRGMDYTRLLYKYHIAAFVNLRNPDEHRDHNWYNEEIIWMKDNGVKYIELPVEKNVPSDGIPDTESCRQFLEIMSDNTNLPVLLHDGSGKKRVAYLAAVWMLKSGGFGLQETMKKAEQIQKEPLDEQEINFLKSLAD
jgi:protein tyrosine/serine phosphatase